MAGGIGNDAEKLDRGKEVIIAIFRLEYIGKCALVLQL